MSDWTSEAIIEAFPRTNMTYYIQFITEPEVVTKESQSGRKYKQASMRLQFFAPDEFGSYHYIGWGEKLVQPCVLEELTYFGPDIITRLIEVKGIEHKRHVDLELINSWDKIPASIPALPVAPPVPPPPVEQQNLEVADGTTSRPPSPTSERLPHGVTVVEAKEPCKHPYGDRIMKSELTYNCTLCGEEVVIV